VCRLRYKSVTYSVELAIPISIYSDARPTANSCREGLCSSVNISRLRERPRNRNPIIENTSKLRLRKHAWAFTTNNRLDSGSRTTEAQVDIPAIATYRVVSRIEARSKPDTVSS